VGNGVDMEYFRPAAGAPPARPPSVVLTGTMDYAPNADAACFFARDVLPRLRARLPDLRFHIVGRDPTRAVRALAAEPGVEVTGAVADVRPYLARAAAAVAPLRVARGIQNKVLEAMAMGVPIVATSAALAGLGAEPGDGARRAEDAEAFAREIDALVTDPVWRRHCAAAARAHVERHHRWEDQGARLLEVLRGVDGSG
jgi:glycosyltransferase involved in cell wall biosynthesis